MKRFAVLTTLVVAASAVFLVAGAAADTAGPITFEPTLYAPGPINGQNGWTNQLYQGQPYDANVVAVSGYPAAAGYGFETQALQISDALITSDFAIQTHSPALIDPSSEASNPHFVAGFSIGTALGTPQPGAHVEVDPDDGAGGRMSYLRFDEQADGVHVSFYDVQQPGSNFVLTDIATFAIGTAHAFTYDITLNPGASNDVVQILMDGSVVHTGTSWEDFYAGSPPAISKLLFRVSGGPARDDTLLGTGYLFDNVSLSSGPLPSAGTALTSKQQAMNGDQKVAQGSTLSAGFDFNMPGKHPAATVGFNGTTVTFPATCASGTPGTATIVVTIPDQSYTDLANSKEWVPSGDKNAASTYQGSAVVPTFCDSGALVRLQKGGTFATNVTSTDTVDKVNLRWHYMDEKGGGWSGTYSVTPS